MASPVVACMFVVLVVVKYAAPCDCEKNNVTKITFDKTKSLNAFQYRRLQIESTSLQGLAALAAWRLEMV